MCSSSKNNKITPLKGYQIGGSSFLLVFQFLVNALPSACFVCFQVAVSISPTQPSQYWCIFSTGLGWSLILNL
ncbi:hypothetical protein EUGRSUZ_L02468 [Eucalyptus grandis]|uniref:Uncharacterized protein n=1 Tax=Eucalyptus grandis TaxID=71139 RepID=A0A058ZRQ6_EUCGR|nr:hypothetical protein EUGRSUZ_L02468 [Eucalyptus grandis]